MFKFHFFIFIFHKKIVQSNTHKILLKMNNFKKLLYKSNISSNPPILFHARSQSSKSDIFFIYRRTTAKKNIVFRSCILILVSPSMTYVAQAKETHPIADTRTECTTVTDKWLSIMIYTRRNNSRPPVMARAVTHPSNNCRPLSSTIRR